MNGLPLWATILSAIGGPTLVTSAFLTVNKIIEIRAVRKEKNARRLDNWSETREQRDADWNADYRAAAEDHVPWDVLMLTTVRILQHSVNELERKAGAPLTEYPVIPDPPPLFPSRRPA